MTMNQDSESHHVIYCVTEAAEQMDWYSETLRNNTDSSTSMSMNSTSRDTLA